MPFEDTVEEGPSEKKAGARNCPAVPGSRPMSSSAARRDLLRFPRLRVTRRGIESPEQTVYPCGVRILLPCVPDTAFRGETMNRIVLLALALVAGCTTPLAHMEPLKSAGQDVEYKNGTPTVISRGPRFDVVVTPSTSETGRYEIGTRLGMMIGVRNRSDRRIEVSESSISATGNDAAAPVLKATDIEDSIRRSARWALGMNAVAGALNSMAASSAGTTTYSASGAVGGAPVHVTGQAYNQGAAMQAQRDADADTAARANAINAQTSASLGGLATAFQRNTIRPGESYVGIAMIEPPRNTACAIRTSGKDGAVLLLAGPCKLKISVDVDGEVHTFNFNEVAPDLTEVAPAPAPAAPSVQTATAQPVAAPRSRFE
jgi:hypothetical protein